MANIPGRRAKRSTSEPVAQQAAPQDAYALLQQIAQQMQSLNDVVAGVAQRVGQLEQVQQQAVVAQAVAPRLEQTPAVQAAQTQVDRQALRGDIENEKEAFWERIQTQPKRKVNFSQDWERDMFGIPIFMRKGLHAVPEEVAQEYERYLEKLSIIDNFEAKWQMLAAQNSRDPGTMHYNGAQRLLHELKG